MLCLDSIVYLCVGTRCALGVSINCWIYTLWPAKDAPYDPRLQLAGIGLGQVRSWLFSCFSWLRDEAVSMHGDKRAAALTSAPDAFIGIRTS